MITKFRKLQDTWFAKTILILTGLSFVSLFGVAGYMGSVGKNSPVIKVDSFEVLQGDLFSQLDRELRIAQKMYGDALEINDTIRLNVLQTLTQNKFNDLLIANIARKNGVSVSDDLVRQVIFSLPAFRNADGNFDIRLLRQMLSNMDRSEKEYTDAIRRDIIRDTLINTPIQNIYVPQILKEYTARINNQKRVFKYITLDLKTLPIDRKISDEEVAQYYQDFNLNFMTPETRDVSFFYLSNDDIGRLIQISDADAEDYYRNNQALFETPETRKVLQMVFDNEDDAKAALAELNTGKSFYAVASDKAKQKQEDTDLGFIAQDMLLEELAEPVFSAEKGKVLGPIHSGMGWHIVKVEAVKAGSKTEKAKAIAEIKDNLKKDRMYDEAYELAAGIEDKIGAGNCLETIASALNAPVLTVKKLSENGQADNSGNKLKNIISAPDFIDMAFSYNAGEISQVIELDDGIALLRVDTVHDSHPKDISEVRPEIEEIWKNNERIAIAQEITNDVLHYVGNGDSIEDIAKRFKLNLKTTAPLLRSQPFAGLSEQQMQELFLRDVYSPQIFHSDGKEIIVVPERIINTAAAAQTNTADEEQIKRDLSADYGHNLMVDFSSDYDVNIDYKLLGMSD